MPPLFVNIASLGKRIFQSAAPVVREIPQETVNLGKKVVAQGYKGFSPTAPVPETFGQALNEGLSLRKQQTIDQFSYDRANPQKGIGETAMNFAGGTTPQKVAGKAAERVFKGFNDLSAKTLEKLKGKTTVSRQFIEDMTNMPELKQAERDLVRGILAETKDQNINVPDFANRVKSELLPLERWRSDVDFGTDFGDAYGHGRVGQYENVTLPDELRGPVANYRENIYQSPIKTSAGDVHFSNDEVPNYFAHTRIEDLPEFANGKPIDGAQTNSEYLSGKTRRVIEIQSDLFQKGRLESEKFPEGRFMMHSEDSLRENLTDAEIFELKDLNKRVYEGQFDPSKKIGPEGLARLQELQAKGEAALVSARNAELAKLEPYRNTWHERVIREEIKQAAKDGKTKLQFPTGETAMKIEGLGQTDNNPWLSASFDRHLTDPDGVKYSSNNKPLKEMVDDLYVGMPIKRSGDAWIITDVLGDGKFKAIPKGNYEANIAKDPDFLKMDEADRLDAMNSSSFTETFDISGKVDTENPIYRFYEKTVARYLTNKYGAKRIKDPQGVEWFEVDVKPEKAKEPILAFGKANLDTITNVGIAAGGLAVALNAVKQAYGLPSTEANRFLEETKQRYPFADEALATLGEVNVRGGGVREGAEAAFTPRGSDAAQFLNSRLVNNPIGRKLIGTKVGQKIAAYLERNDKPTIRFKDLGLTKEETRQVVPTIVAHELLHQIFERKFEDSRGSEDFARDFYNAWNDVMRQESEASTISEDYIETMEDIDAHIFTGSVYEGIDDYHAAHERFAYLGELAMEKGIDAIPPPLRPFYAGVIKAENVAESTDVPQNAEKRVLKSKPVDRESLFINTR